MSGRRSNASPGGSYWEEPEDDEGYGGGGFSAGYRSSAAPSSVSAASIVRPRAAPPEHFADANLYQGTEQDAQENFKVFIRVRPPVPRELNSYRNFVDVVRTSQDAPGAITLCDAVETEDKNGMSAGTVVYSRQSFTFDYVYPPQAAQDEVYDRSARPAVLSVLEGYNATLMAYGQTGTGKTYTMEGFTNEAERGIIPRAVEDVFGHIRASRSDGQTKFLVRASYMQIYNEAISDLLVPPGTLSASGGPQGRAMTVRHTPQRGVYVDGLSEWIVRSPRDVYGLIERGTAHRATSSTRMSELSSRSHAIFTIVVEVLEGDERAPISYRFGKLNIVDLAGSEKVRQSGVSGQRLEETKKINRSLHELGNVISALASKSTGSGSRSRHIPFRNSVLTSALRDSLGGNCKTTLIACLSPALESYTESLSTLMFANRAKNIRTSAVVNEDMDQAMLLRKYEKELKHLRELLHDQQQQQQHVMRAPVDGGASSLTELEQGRQRAEEDREAALAALEQSSQTCAQLEQRIHELETMMDEGGFAGGPRTSEEYATRLQELDRERLMMQEDKAQVDRYKQLLLKQRDIMLNLTTRLNERDETILQLQEEVDAYDAHVALLEAQLADLEAEAEAEAAAAAGGQVEGERGTRQTSKRGHSSGGGGGGGGGGMSHADAVQYLKQCRVLSNQGQHQPQYRSDTDPATLLTAEEKLLEVLMGSHAVANSNGRRSMSPASPLASQLRLTDEEVAQLKSCARQRLDTVAASAAAAEAQALRGQVEALAMQLAASDARAQLYEAYLDLQKPSVNGTQEELMKALLHEAADLKKDCAARAQALADSVAREHEERRRLARELDRLRFEVEQQQASAQVTPQQKSSVSRLWQAVQALEEELLPAGGDRAAVTSPLASPAASSARALQAAVAEKEKAWRRVLEDKQRTIDGLLLRQAQAGEAPDASALLAAKDADIAALQRELTIQKKDRRALKTILDQRMKGKVDRICELLAEGSPTDAEKLTVEAKSLRTLLHASIKAMDS